VSAMKTTRYQTRIRAARKAAGLTLNQLAGRAKVSIGHLSDAERGNRGLSVDALRRIGDALSLDWRELID